MVKQQDNLCACFLAALVPRHVFQKRGRPGSPRDQGGEGGGGTSTREGGPGPGPGGGGRQQKKYMGMEPKPDTTVQSHDRGFQSVWAK